LTWEAVKHTTGELPLQPPLGVPGVFQDLRRQLAELEFAAPELDVVLDSAEITSMPFEKPATGGIRALRSASATPKETR
jgi:hypothetical protein